MLNLEQLLRAHGHEVAVFAMDYPENLETPWRKYFPQNMSKVMAFTRPFGSWEVRRKFSRLLDDFHPDVVHLNNIHTQLSPVIAELAHQRGIRVVWTLHDYKLLCPRYDCLKHSKTICETCFKGDKRACLDNRCMKESTLASFIGYREATTWNRSWLAVCIVLNIVKFAFPIEGSFILPDLVVFSAWLIYAIGAKDLVLNNRVVKYLSGISMEIYLSHMMFFRVASMLHLERFVHQQDVLYVLTCIMTLIGAMCFSHIVKYYVFPLMDKRLSFVKI